MIVARVATSADVPVLAALLEQAVAQTPQARGGRLSGFPGRERPAQERLRCAVDDPSSDVFAGEFEGFVAGIALIRLVPEVPGTLLARVDELFVTPDAREVGVGESLLDACVKWARDRNCDGIDVECLPGARSAKNLAERSGFSARLLVMHRRLSDAGAPSDFRG